jgi:hypothetical protein
MVAWLHAVGQNIMVVGVCDRGISHALTDRKARGRQRPGASYDLEDPAPSNPLSAAGPCLLKFPDLSK